MTDQYSDKKYKSIKIPGFLQNDDAKKERSSSGQDAPAARPQDNIFYEIEYDNSPFQGVGKYVRKLIPIVFREKDPIREKFKQMRDIARANRTYYLNSNKFNDSKVQREKAHVFYKQAVFMKDFTDDYEKSVPYSSYYPFYQMMGYEQLRTYFTWRTKVREGIVEDTSLSYAFLYIYELLNHIGVDNPEDGLKKIMFFWNKFRVYDQTIDKYVVKWLKDYHIYYEVPHSFKDFILQNNLENHYPQIVKYGDDFELFCSISKYDIRKSAFYTEERQELIKGCFFYTTEKLKRVLAGAGMNYEETIFQPMKKMSIWTPFTDALFYPWLQQRDRRVVLSENEIYVCSRNCWKFNKTLTTENGRKFLGYVMKQMENVLRTLTKYRYSLKANVDGVSPAVLSVLEAVDISLEELITQTVREYYRETTKTVVKVDLSALNKIRQEAWITQEKLTVDEDLEESGIWKTEMVEGDSITMQTSKGEYLLQPQSADSWDELSSLLNQAEHKALMIILRGECGLKQFADEQGLMLEVLIDGINEKAMDVIGDSLLEDEFTIYEDYIEQVKEMVCDL